MAYFKSLATKTGKAIHDFKMIQEGDKILICYSGGKDSYMLIKILEYLKRKYPINFELKILTVDPGFDPGVSTISNVNSLFEFPETATPIKSTFGKSEHLPLCKQ